MIDLYQAAQAIIDTPSRFDDPEAELEALIAQAGPEGEEMADMLREGLALAMLGGIGADDRDQD